jgi:putative PIN family toxin of toxin-antitoxin system
MEIRELPSKLSPRLKITSQRVEGFVLDLVSFARHVQVVPARYELRRDPDDSHYINLALAADAKWITSRDRDLLHLMDTTAVDGCEFQRLFPELRIITPEQLLAHVRG